MIERRKIFIDGKWVDSSSREVLAVVNPVTEETIATVPRGTADDVDRATHAAAAAFAGWSQTPVEQRSGVFSRLARLMEARADEITRTIVSELGYPGRAGRQVAGGRGGGGTGPHRANRARDPLGRADR